MKGLIIVVIIIIIAIGGFLLLRDGSDKADLQTDETVDVVDENSPTLDTNNMPATDVDDIDETAVEADTTPEVMVVTYTTAGFEPKNITVSKGQIVRFVNEGTGKMWVASDEHPSHKILPEFDQLSIGDSYEFKFETTGTWKYHNHVNPSAIGTITVE